MNKKLSLFLILVSVGLLTALAAGPVFGQAADGLGKADAAREKHTDALLAKPGVVGVALGYNPAGRASVTVYAEHSEVKDIPRELDGVPVHVVVTGELMALSPGTATGLAPATLTTTDRWPRPVPIGVSTGHPDITACTIGARLTDGTNVYALSNNHCYANSNEASIGDAVIQPGTYDGGFSAADDIGTLADFEPIVFSTEASNVIDAAIALSSTANLGTSTPSDGYGTPNSTTVAAVLKQKVQKYGRTTGHTANGRITGINATVNIGYGAGTARFVNQIIVQPGSFIAGGDSGSLMVIKGGSDDLKPVGLLFAGSPMIAIANPIDAVLAEFGVTIDDSTGPPPAPTPGITVSPMSGLDTTEAGGTDTFTMVLNTQPTADVTIALSSNDASEGTVLPTSLTFTSGDWDTAQTVTVKGVDDADSDGNIAYKVVTATAVSTDSDYSVINPADVSVTNADDESSSGGALSVSVATDKDIYVNRENVMIFTHVTDGDTNLSGVTVMVVITTAKGKKLYCSPITDDDGIARCRYKVNANRDGYGIYDVVVNATKSGYTSGSASTKFEVK